MPTGPGYMALAVLELRVLPEEGPHPIAMAVGIVEAVASLQPPH